LKLIKAKHMEKCLDRYNLKQEVNKLFKDPVIECFKDCREFRKFMRDQLYAILDRILLEALGRPEGNTASPQTNLSEEKAALTEKVKSLESKLSKYKDKVAELQQLLKHHSALETAVESKHKPKPIDNLSEFLEREYVLKDQVRSLEEKLKAVKDSYQSVLLDIERTKSEKDFSGRIIENLKKELDTCSSIIVQERKTVLELKSTVEKLEWELKKREGGPTARKCHHQVKVSYLERRNGGFERKRKGRRDHSTAEKGDKYTENHHLESGNVQSGRAGRN